VYFWRWKLGHCGDSKLCNAFPLLCLVWWSWYDGNRRIFEGDELPLCRIKHVFLSSLFQWMPSDDSLSLFVLDFFLLSICHFGGGTAVHCLHCLPFFFFSLINSYLLKNEKTKGATRCLLCLVKPS
jgi:hypothetical protein